MHTYPRPFYALANYKKEEYNPDPCIVFPSFLGRCDKNGPTMMCVGTNRFPVFYYGIFKGFTAITPKTKLTKAQADELDILASIAEEMNIDIAPCEVNIEDLDNDCEV